jgi:hypothetical protein
MTIQPANKIIVRSWPTLIFLWPTALTALAAGLALALFPELATARVWGGAFLVVFALCLVVLTFDFPRSTSLTLLFAAIALAWLFVELNRRYNLIRPLQDFLASLDVTVAPDFYLLLFAVYLVLFVAMFIGTRFNYWEITSNEIVHHKGLMRDVERHATAGLQYQKQITDFFEYLLAGSGRLVFQAPAMPTTLVLNNVLGINRVARRLDALLEVQRVAPATAPVRPAPPQG